jgi:hypothetical protein
MQRYALLALVIRLDACSPVQAPDPAPMPNVAEACQDAWMHIDKDIKIRQSTLLQKVESLACYYGVDQYVTVNSCSVPVDISEMWR